MSKRIEYILSLAALSWGLWVLSPWWDAFTTAATFGPMARVGSEVAWGSAYSLVGLIGLLAAWRGSLLIRRVSLILSMFGWMIITVFYAAGNVYGTGFIPYLYLSLISATVFVEVR